LIEFWGRVEQNGPVNMREALIETQKAVDEGMMPFGAVLANRDGDIIARAHNQCEAAGKRGGGMGDVTRHAEMELIRQFTVEIPESERVS